MRYRTGLAVRCFALGVLALLVLAPAWAEDPVAAYEAIKRASLKGLEAREVVVPPLNMDAGCRPVAPEDLQAEVEARLDDGGVLLGPSMAARLVIGVTATEAVKDLLCGFTVTVRTPARHPQRATWGPGSDQTGEQTCPP